MAEREHQRQHVANPVQALEWPQVIVVGSVDTAASAVAADVRCHHVEARGT
jgi:hypothetical protein